MRFSRSFGAAATILLSLCIPASISRAAVPTAATRALIDDKISIKGMVTGERLTALYGAPLATSADYPGEPDFVAAFLADPAHGADSFGVENVVLSLADQIIIRGGELTVYTYQQKIEGLPVHGSVVKLTVLHGVPDKIVYAGIRLVPHPESPLPADVVTAAGAILNVQQSQEYGHLTNFDDANDADKVIFEDDLGSLHRAWRFSGWGGSGSFEAYRFLVDTASGDIVGVENRIFEAQSEVSGTLRGYRTPGIVAPSPTNPPVSELLPGSQVSAVDGTPTTCPAIDEPVIAGPIPADPTGGFGFSLILPARVTGRLAGDGVTVVSCEEVASPSQCLGRLFFGIFVEPIACEPVPDSEPTVPAIDLVFGQPSCVGGADVGNACDPTEILDCPGGACAWDPHVVDAVTVFDVVQKTRNWFLTLQPTFSGLDFNVLAAVNVQEWSNAGYHSVARVLVFGEGRQGFSNSFAFSTVISHEYGHFIALQLLDRPPQTGPFAEGVADCVAMLMWDTEMLGLGIFIEEEEKPFRNLDIPDFPLGGCLAQPGNMTSDCTQDGACFHPFGHCQGMALAGAFWDVRKQTIKCVGGSNHGGLCDPDVDCVAAGEVCDTAHNDCTDGTVSSCLDCCTPHSDCPGGTCTDDSDVERLFSDFLFVTDGGLDESVLVEVLIADDDDGDLTTMSPLQPAIENAFIGTGLNQHGWPERAVIMCEPVAGDVVDVQWVGPIFPFEEPVPGVDYFVHYFYQNGECKPYITLKTTEKDLIDVDRWIIGRTITGAAADLGVPPDFGAILTDWSTPAHNIEVRVGTDPNANVRDVSVVEIRAQAACLGGTNADAACTRDADCPSGGTCSTSNWSSILLQLGGACIGGTNAGEPCAEHVDCPGGGPPDVRCSSVGLQRTCFGLGDRYGQPCETDSNCGTNQVCSAGNVIGRVQAYGSSSGTCFGGSSDGGACNKEADCPGGTCGMGGRVGGKLLGSAGQILGRSIGIGEATAGTLTVTRLLSDMIIDSITTGSSVSASRLSRGLHISEALNGLVEISGDLVGLVKVAGSGLSSGDILVDGFVATPIDIAGDMAGDIVADADRDNSGTITGNVTVAGEFNGNICDAALDVLVNPLIGDLPTNISLTFGPCGRICGHHPSDAPAFTAAPMAETILDQQGAPAVNIKNRFISFLGQNPGRQTAVRVTFTNLPAPYDIWSGEKLWVGPPSEVSESGANVPPTIPFPNFWAATLSCTPHFTDWTTFGTVHVFHEGIIPLGTYEIKEVDSLCRMSDENNFSNGLQITTAVWGDTVLDLVLDPPAPPNGPPVNLDDVLAIIERFSSATGSIAKARADLEPACLDLVINISDVLMSLRGFSGLTYPFTPSAPNPCNSPCVNPLDPGSGGGDGPSGELAEASFSLVANAELIEPGQGVNVDVFVSSADVNSPVDLAGYQVALEVTGGTAGSLTLTAVTVDDTRQDYVFLANSSNDLVMIDQGGARMGNVLTDGTAVAVTDPVYLATFSYVPTEGAEGEFHVAVKGGNASGLIDSNDEGIPWEAAGCWVIGVGVDCLTDAHCDDNNDCTLDTCVANACTFSNQPTGFACDDGKFCTTGETCDGAGTCNGGNPTCGPGQLCCELTDECGPCKLLE